jgi:hypothetical protein
MWVMWVFSAEGGHLQLLGQQPGYLGLQRFGF